MFNLKTSYKLLCRAIQRSRRLSIKRMNSSICLLTWNNFLNMLSKEQDVTGIYNTRGRSRGKWIGTQVYKGTVYM